MGKVGVVFLPLWLAGHQNSMLELAKLLCATNNDISIKVLLINPPTSQGVSPLSHPSIQHTYPSGLDIHFEDLPQEEPPPQDSDGLVDFLSLFLQSHVPHVKSAITASSIPIAALVVDFFATTMIDVANELGIPIYIHFTTTALMLSLMLHLPTLEEKIPIEFEEVQGDIEIDGIAAIPPLSMPSPLMSKRSQEYTWLVYHGRRFPESNGIIINTFMELEPALLLVLGKGRFMCDQPLPPLYSIGPALSIGDAATAEAGSDRHKCCKWLDVQPGASVVFLCFGSMGSFDPLQVREMATGLEQSGHRFLWSLRSMPTGDNRQPTDANLDEVLPEGFLERTKDRGMVWPSWVPQVEILSHAAVGGFVTHCGWNSVLESLWFGVPMIAWPQYAEQHLNEVELVRDLGVAVGLKLDRKRGNFVAAAELERGVRCLMGESEESKRVRAKVADMKLASRNALKEGGSSYNSLKKLAKDLCS